MVFSACFVLSPGGDSLWFVTVGTEGFLRAGWQTGAPSLNASDGASGPHDLGRRAKAMGVGRILRPGPHRTASSSAGGPRPLTLRPDFHAPSVQGERPVSGLAPCNLNLRPDAAASTASRPAYRDDRETPLSTRRDAGFIVLDRNVVKEDLACFITERYVLPFVIPRRAIARLGAREARARNP